MVSNASPVKCSSSAKFTRVPLSDKINSGINLDIAEGEKGQWGLLSEEPVDVEERSRDQLCGVGDWRPGWLQKCASHRVYAVSYVIVGVVQGMIYSYFNGVITTVEKAFAVPSSMMGFVLSGNDISQILCGVLVTYIAGRGSRPFWLAMGMLITAGSLFLYASAQLFYDPEMHEVGRNSAFLNESSQHVMCNAHEDMAARLGDAVESSTCTTRPSSIPALVVFFVGQFISGIGSTAIFTLGFTYMDDGVKRSAFPLYMTITGALRSLGPALGFLLASSCLKIYIEPTKTTEYTQRDVRWLGAWWLGFLVIGTLQIIITFPVLLFPKELPKANKSTQPPITPTKTSVPEKEVTKSATLTDIKKTVQRMGKNPIVVFQLLCAGPFILGMVGFSMFLPKYMEANFGKTAAQATMITGSSSMLMMMVGSVSGGLFVWKFQPSAFKLTVWGGISDLLYAIGILTIMTFACDSVDFVGVNFDIGALEVTSPCSKSCGCDMKFDPICIQNQNYLSPCLAGCETFRTENTTVFLNCTCATTSSLLNVSSSWTQQEGTIGYCPGSRGNCAFFFPYVMILSSVKLIASSTRVGGMLVLLRSVDKRDKAVGMALWGAVASLLGFIPGPIIYGAVVDATCILWNQKPCGGKGNCWLYNLDSLRYWFHGITAVSFCFAGLCDFITCLFCRELDLYNDDPGRVLTFSEGFHCKKDSKPNYLQAQTRYSISSMRLRSYEKPPS